MTKFAGRDIVHSMTVTVAAFYKFVTIDAPETLRDSVAAACEQNGILGTVLIAREGINATISGHEDAIEAFLVWLREDARFEGLAVKISYAEADPFKRIKVRVKPEIVTFGVPDISPAEHVGTYVAPDAWNALIQDPDVVVIDTRNAYEVAIGTFEGAVDPKTDAFSDFPDYVARHLNPARHKRVAMFCTGGIRCEKASAYLLAPRVPRGLSSRRRNFEVPRNGAARDKSLAWGMFCIRRPRRASAWRSGRLAHALCGVWISSSQSGGKGRELRGGMPQLRGA